MKSNRVVRFNKGKTIRFERQIWDQWGQRYEVREVLEFRPVKSVRFKEGAYDAYISRPGGEERRATSAEITTFLHAGFFTSDHPFPSRHLHAWLQGGNLAVYGNRIPQFVDETKAALLNRKQEAA